MYILPVYTTCLKLNFDKTKCGSIGKVKLYHRMSVILCTNKTKALEGVL